MSVHSVSPSPLTPAAGRGLWREARARPTPDLSIGIVVPVFNEAPILVAALERLEGIACGARMVVADGGSTDGSAQIAGQVCDTVICPRANRGAQQNLGAARLEADVLLFLHADTRLPVGFNAHIREALRDPRVAGGCFQLEFDPPTPMLRLYSWCTQFPGRFLHFGDQAFFVRREVFERMGGFRNLPFLEDVDFLRRLRRYGRFAVLPVPVISSSRRFLRRGVVRQQIRNILLVTLFELGVSSERLAKLYPHVR